VGPGNPLAQVRLDKPVRPHPVIWTDERVEAWRRDGIRPPVAVWTPRQLVTFLTGVENDPMHALARASAGGATATGTGRHVTCAGPDVYPAWT
jgi:hypothetical protein